MNALFVLLPAGVTIEQLLMAAPPELHRALAGMQFRRYPRADDASHLASLVRSGRDPVATTWRRGMVKAIALGAGLGTTTNGVLAVGFGMFGGLSEIAIPLGLGVGAFLGGFTAAMTGTETPRDEVRSLLPHFKPGDELCSWAGAAIEDLRLLRTLCQARGLAVTLRG